MPRSRTGLAVATAALSLSTLGVPSAHAAYTWSVVTVKAGGDFTEPGVDVDPTSNTVYVNAPRGLGSYSAFWRSTAPGTAGSWAATELSTLLSRRATGPGGGDSDVAIHPTDGSLAYTDLWLGSSSVGKSTDMGSTWVAQPYNVPVQDRQWLAAAGPRTYFVTHQIASGLVVSKSYDGGVAYPTATLAASVSDQGLCICPPGNLIARPQPGDVSGPLGLQDRVGAIYSTGTGVAYSCSTDGGTTWSRRVVDPSGGGSTVEAFPVVAAGPGDVLHAVWSDVGSGSSVIRYSRATSWCGTWTTPVTIGPAGSNIFPWVAVSGAKVGVAFYHNTTPGNPNNASGNWHVKYLEGTYSSAGAHSVAWENSPQSPDATAVKTGPICTDGLNCAGNRELGDFLQVAMLNNGKPIISYIRVGASGNDVLVAVAS